MLQPNVQYVIRFWDSKVGVTRMKVGFMEEIKDIIRLEPCTNIRVWELETDLLKKVQL